MKGDTLPPNESQLRARAADLIEKQSTMTLSTAVQDNPWAAPVYYVNLGFDFFFFSDPGSRHIQESQAAGKAAAAIFHPSDSWQEIRGVQMSGEIKALRPGLESLRALRAYLKKFPFTREFFDSGDRLDLEGFAKRFRVRLFRFRPSLLYYLDNRIRFSFREEVKMDTCLPTHHDSPETHPSRINNEGGESMSLQLSASAEKVQETLKAMGLECQVIELPGSTRTAAEAASAVGCKVEQIAKSLVFQGKTSGKPMMVIASGGHRVNEKKLRDLVSEPVRKADAGFVRAHTGFAIGGIPPVGHAKPMEIYIDKDLFSYDQIWAAAGTPHAVFKLTPAELTRITGGKTVDIS